MALLLAAGVRGEHVGVMGVTPPMQCNKVRCCGGKQQLCGQSHKRPDWCGKCGYGVWVPGCGAEHPKAEQHPYESTWLQAVHSILRYQV